MAELNFHEKKARILKLYIKIYVMNTSIRAAPAVMIT